MIKSVIWMSLATFAGGCATMTPGSLDRVSPVSERPRAGNVYLLRGFIGIFSDGINHLGEKIDAAGVRANIYQDDQWDTLAAAIEQKYKGVSSPEPLILIGHSFGADDVVRISRRLESAKIQVDLLVTLDPVTPPKVPGNVRRCINLYQSNGIWDNVPAFRGIPLQLADGSHADLKNMDIRRNRTDLLEPGTDHFNIEKKASIHREVIREILATCPPRQQWAGAHIVPALEQLSRPAATATLKSPSQAVNSGEASIKSTE